MACPQLTAVDECPTLAAVQPREMSMHESFPDGAFLVGRQGGAGLSRRKARSIQLWKPTRALRVAANSEGVLATRCRVIQLVLPEGAAFVGVTAAHLHGIPLPPWLPEPAQPDVAVPKKQNRPQRLAIQSHQWRPDPSGFWVVDGVRVTSAARTWLDLAAVLPADYLVAAGDHVLAHRLGSLGDLKAVIAWARRRRGVCLARAVIDGLSARADSPPESRVRFWLNYHGLPTPKINEIVVVNGEFLAKCDLVFEEQKVILEYDGNVHLAEEQRRKDQTRRNLLQSNGWYLIVLTADDLKNPYQMCRMIHDVLMAR